MQIISDYTLYYFFEAMVNDLSSEDRNWYIQTLKKDSERPLVVHNKTGQITVVLNGRGIVSDGEKRFDIVKTNIILINSKCPHSFFTDEKLQLMHIHIPATTIKEDREILIEYFDTV